MVKLALWLFICAKVWTHDSAPSYWVCTGKMPAHGSLLSSHLILKTSIPLSIYSILHSCHFIVQPFSLWLLLCFLISSSFLCSVLGAAVPCCEQPGSYQGDLICVCVCVCLQSSSLSVSCVKVKSSSGRCTAACSSWLKSAFSSPSVTPSMVSHQPFWQSDCSNTCASSWIPALYTQSQFPVRMDKGLKMSTYQTCLWCPT